jgi:hypothetical protein
MPPFNFVDLPAKSSFSYIAKHMTTLQITNQQQVILSILSNTKSKFRFFNECINNVFFDAETKNDFTLLFDKIQRTYNSFRKFAYIYKFRKSKLVVTDDLCSNPIQLNQRNIICIYQAGNRYLFNILDLNKIINTSLANSSMFFSTPLPIKNPYTNLPFNKSTLYNIYFFIQFNTNYTNELFNLFYKSNFNLTIFFGRYEHMLREYTIEHYIETTDTETLHADILNMIFMLNQIYMTPEYQLNIDDDFPKQTLIRVMKPYLRLWIDCGYSLIPCKAAYSVSLLIRKFRYFVKHSRGFGRKVIHCERVWSFKTNSLRFKHIYSFIETHALFNKKNTSFMSNHVN